MSHTKIKTMLNNLMSMGIARGAPRRRYVLLVIFLSWGQASWSMQKCNSPNGAVVFQDQPCAGSGASVADDIKARAAQNTANRAAEQNKKTSRAIEEEEPQITIAKAECGGLFPDYPQVGMRETTFLQCTHLGRFWTDRSINETTTKTSVSKQYVFGGASGIRPDIKYLYTRNGVITVIQR